jgi:hypothetical protein
MLLFRGYRLAPYIPVFDHPTLDLSVLGVACGITMLAAAAAGVVPVVVASMVPLGVLVQGATQRTASRSRVPSLLLVLQLAMTFVLCGTAIALRTSLQHLLTTSTGLRVEGLTMVTLRPEDFGYSDVDARFRLLNVVDALSVSGLQAAVSYPHPFDGSEAVVRLQTDAMAAPERRIVSTVSVTPSFFSVVGLPLRAGRSFSSEEFQQSSGVEPTPVVVSELLALHLFGQPTPIGKSFRLERFLGAIPSVSSVVVIGVVNDTRSGNLRAGPREVIYHMMQSSLRHGTILVRGTQALRTIESDVRRIAAQVLPDVPVSAVTSADEEMTTRLGDDLVMERVSALLGFVAIVLAAIGAAGSVVQVVKQQERSFAVRIALGARPSQLVSKVLVGMLRTAAIGSAVGLIGYLIVGRWLSSRLYGLTPTNIFVLLGSVVVLVSLMTIVTFVITARLTRFEPWPLLK